MDSNQPAKQHQWGSPDDPGSSPVYRASQHGLIIYNNSQNMNQLHGSGRIENHNHITTYIDARPPAPPAPYISDLSISVTLPPKPIVFHGRHQFVDDAIALLIGSGTVRLAVLGAGGMGKTTVVLAILHDPRVVSHYSSPVQRLFLSCEALVDANSIVVSLAKLLGLPASGDLFNTIVTYFSSSKATVLVLDNLETVWLANGVPVPAVDELLGRLAEIPSISLIVTCRGSFLSQLVEWTNAESAILEQFSLEAALQTFQDKAGRRLSPIDESTARQLLDAVDRMPLAVSLLGQLARRGSSVSELLDRWNREHTALLRTHGTGRFNNVAVSIELSIAVVGTTDDSGEALELLSLCSMLPDGLRPNVFAKLRPLFNNIDHARDTLSAYSLASIGPDRVLRVLSPVRHLVVKHHSAQPFYRDALYTIYFDIASCLPMKIDESFQQLLEAAAPEIGNLSSLLLALVDEPSDQLVRAIVNFTHSSCLHQPTTTLASALLPHLGRPVWKADCLRIIGTTQFRLSEYRLTISSLDSATQLFLDLDNWSHAASCKLLSADAHRFLREYDAAEALLTEAWDIYAGLDDKFGVADSRSRLGELLRMRKNFTGAVEHLSAARHTFDELLQLHSSAQCSDMLGLAYVELGYLSFAADELEAARAIFVSFGNQRAIAQNLRYLGSVRRRQGDFGLAEKHLNEAEAYFKISGIRHELAACAYELAALREDQGKQAQAIGELKTSLRLYEELGVAEYAAICRREIARLQSST